MLIKKIEFSLFSYKKTTSISCLNTKMTSKTRCSAQESSNASVPASSPCQQQDDPSVVNNNGDVSQNLYLAAILSAAINRIRRGEFENFDDLKPSNFGRSSASNIVLIFDGENLLLSNDNSHDNKGASHPKKARVTDFVMWPLAWSLFFQVLSQVTPHLVTATVKVPTFHYKLRQPIHFFGLALINTAFRRHISSNTRLVGGHK